MAVRPVFLALPDGKGFETVNTDFEWARGTAPTQKQKSIVSLHEAFLKKYPDKKILEVSSKSKEEIGVALSAFNLKLFVPSLGKSIPVECAFQAGKVFEKGGPYTDLLEKSSKEAKKDPRIHESGSIIAFEFEGERYPTEPQTAFYDMLYMKALEENPELAEKILEYDAFTDIEFLPGRSVNCQAKTCALYKSKHT